MFKQNPLSSTDYQGLINEYCVSSDSTIRKYTLFDFWCIFSCDVITRKHLVKSEKDKIIFEGKKYIPNKQNELSVEEIFSHDGFIKSITDNVIAKKLMEYIDVISVKASTQLPNIFELKNYIPFFYHKYHFDNSAFLLGRNYMVVNITDPIAGFPAYLIIEEDSGLIKVKMDLNILYIDKRLNNQP